MRVATLDSDPTTALVQVATVLGRYRFRYANEDQLQEGLAAVLAEHGFDVKREVRLDARNRIDMMVGAVGIEVKVAGRAAAVVAQCARYAEFDALDALVLVTSRVRHLLAPTEINGKPFHVVSLAEHGL